MSGPTPLSACEFTTTRTGRDGLFYGHCTQYPDLRTRGHKTSIDALDAIVTAARDKIADLDAAIAGYGPARRTDA